MLEVCETLKNVHTFDVDHKKIQSGGLLIWQHGMTPISLHIHQTFVVFIVCVGMFMGMRL